MIRTSTSPGYLEVTAEGEQSIFPLEENPRVFANSAAFQQWLQSELGFDIALSLRLNYSGFGLYLDYQDTGLEPDDPRSGLMPEIYWITDPVSAMVGGLTGRYEVAGVTHCADADGDCNGRPSYLEKLGDYDDWALKSESAKRTIGDITIEAKSWRTHIPGGLVMVGKAGTRGQIRKRSPTWYGLYDFTDFVNPELTDRFWDPRGFRGNQDYRCYEWVRRPFFSYQGHLIAWRQYFICIHHIPPDQRITATVEGEGWYTYDNLNYFGFTLSDSKTVRGYGSFAMDEPVGMGFFGFTGFPEWNVTKVCGKASFRDEPSRFRGSLGTLWGGGPGCVGFDFGDDFGE